MRRKYPTFRVSSSRRSYPSPPASSSSPDNTQISSSSIDQRKNPSLYDEIQPGGIGSAPQRVETAEGGGQEEEEVEKGLRRRPPEVLAPAGGWDQMKAAVQAGADAVYFGLDSLNARARAHNFAVNELDEVMEFLHERGVKGYVTLNVLVFDNELDKAEHMIRYGMAKAGVDAVIVQDLGIVELIRKCAPHLPVHGSTQMSITSAQGAEFAHSLGAERVVVGRELSVKEIASISRSTKAEVECFVHGAICVSYSGQCFSSEAWGGRSANRGQCAQGCRMPYGLLVNGTLRDLGDIKYLLSPQDMMAINQVPGLVKAGVHCFKIEGRLKGPAYVAITTQMYRKAVDHAWSDMLAGALQGATEGSNELLSEVDLVDLSQVFARGQDGEHKGLTPGFLEGPKHQRLVRGRSPRHRGVYVGRVTHVRKDQQQRGGGIYVELEANAVQLKRGDGVAFDRGLPEESEEGGLVYEIFDSDGHPLVQVNKTQGRQHLAFKSNQIDLSKVRKGNLVWRTSDKDLEQRLDRMLRQQEQQVASPVSISISGKLHEPIRIHIEDQHGNSGVGYSEGVLEPAQKKFASSSSSSSSSVHSHALCRPIDGFCHNCTLTSLPSGLFLPASQIKTARREAIDDLKAERVSTFKGVEERATLPLLLKAARGSSETEGGGLAAATSPMTEQTRKPDGKQRPKLSLLCRTHAQVLAAMDVEWLDEVILDFLEVVHGLKEACASVRKAGKRLIVATPRILKPDEDRIWRFYLNLEADALLIRSAGLLHHFLEMGGGGAYKKIPLLHGDFSLNAANTISAALFLDRGLERLCPTHDVNADQLVALARSMGSSKAERLEAIIHQHLPVFHTEHCVFCRFLSTGNDYKDCGHPCEKNQLHLRDQEGQDHLVLADMGCRNTVFNAKAQSGASFLPALAAAGFSRFRIELVDEPAEQVQPILQRYRDVLEGEMPHQELWKWLHSIPDANGLAQGVTKGSLEPKAERKREDLKPTSHHAKNNNSGRDSGGGRRNSKRSKNKTSGSKVKS
eukprot:jgi/Bigna1/34861/e_gw1.7.7.1